MARQRSNRTRRHRGGSFFPLLLATSLGLAAGFALSSPLARLVEGPEPKTASKAAWSNPFASWVTFGQDNDVLILGTDVGGGNTDVIAAMRVEGGHTTITQIPRDSYIETEQYGPMKINALYNAGGPEALKKEVASRLGRPIHHHMIVNLGAIRRIADTIGGIEVNVPKRMFYTDNTQGLYIDLQPGLQTLKGRDLEGFLRFRHDETGDIGRMERQQLAVQALFRKLTRPEQLIRLPALVMLSGKDLQTDLGPMELGGLITAMTSTDLKIHHLEGRPFDQGGVSYLEIDWPGHSEPGASPEPPSKARHSFFLF